MRKKVKCYQYKNRSSGLDFFFVLVVLDDADGAEGREAEEEAVDVTPAVTDAEQGRAGRDVAQDEEKANPNGNNVGFGLKMKYILAC
jgi:hypothetical protein